MQSGADGEGKCPTLEGGYDICLFDVAAGKEFILDFWIFWIFKKNIFGRCRVDGADSLMPLDWEGV